MHYKDIVVIALIFMLVGFYKVVSAKTQRGYVFAITSIYASIGLWYVAYRMSAKTLSVYDIPSIIYDVYIKVVYLAPAVIFN